MISYYRPKDILTSLEKGVKLSNKEIKNRKEAFLIEVKNNKVFFFSGQDAVRKIERYYPELLIKKDIKEINGVSASPGRAEGEIAVVKEGNFEQLSKWSKKFKEGQILVTEMTQPNMLPIMRKSCAIITDEGGLTSHAAIISREFGIPCIVGTHKATKVLKDGDLVKVDANKGTIRILKKNTIQNRF